MAEKQGLTPEEREKLILIESAKQGEAKWTAGIRETLDKVYDELIHTPIVKRNLALRIFYDILASEAFIEAYPTTENEEQLKRVLTRCMWKNRISTEDGKRIFTALVDEYESDCHEPRLHSDKSDGTSSTSPSKISHS